ncbi:MAG: hypothetical protein FJX57_11110 [Alphaproteobacteria bacterium]|nr:hypothetical protein [Alphaproteobacteria bacterium]
MTHQALKALEGRQLLIAALVSAGLALAALPVDPAAAAQITFSSRSVAIASPNFGSIPGHGVSPGAIVPGWTWNYTGNHATTRLPARIANFNEHICIGPGGACGSNDNDGVTGNEYAGFEFIYFTFSLPSNATNVRLIFEDFDADDRAALLVNGTLIGGFKSTAADVGGTLVTNMKDGAGNHTVLFLDPPVPVINDPSLFHAGENYFALWVNNTNSLTLTAPAIAHISSGDPSAIRLRGGILFDEDVVTPPTHGVAAPATLALLAFGLPGIAVARRRSRES